METKDYMEQKLALLNRQVESAEWSGAQVMDLNANLERIDRRIVCIWEVLSKLTESWVKGEDLPKDIPSDERLAEIGRARVREAVIKDLSSLILYLTEDRDLSDLTGEDRGTITDLRDEAGEDSEVVGQGWPGRDPR